jgi:hypothetical protein
VGACPDCVQAGCSFCLETLSCVSRDEATCPSGLLLTEASCPRKSQGHGQVAGRDWRNPMQMQVQLTVEA